MTETEWVSSTDPLLMLESLGGTGRLSDRKARLFAVACCRSIWGLFADERSRQAVEVAERYADGAATAQELDHACEAVRVVAFDARWDIARQAAWGTCWRCLWSEFGEEADGGAVIASTNAAWEARRRRSAEEDEYLAQAALLRCLFGPRPGVSIGVEPRWRTPAALGLARAIYEERRWEDTPVLADTLEDAGCTNAEVLDHCRKPGPHARGCFVIDTLLGKS